MIDTKEYRGYTIEIYVDDFPMSPREWDNLGRFSWWSREVSHLTEDGIKNAAGWLLQYIPCPKWPSDTPFRAITEDMRRHVHADKEEYGYYSWADFYRDVELELYVPMQEATERVRRSGDVMWITTTAHNDHYTDVYGDDTLNGEFDGRDGVYYVERAAVLKEWKRTRMSKKLREKVSKILQGEVKVYGHYAAGEVYGYVVKDPDGEDTDMSCWGFYGDYHDDYMLGEAKAQIDWQIKHDAEERAEHIKRAREREIALNAINQPKGV